MFFRDVWWHLSTAGGPETVILGIVSLVNSPKFLITENLDCRPIFLHPGEELLPLVNAELLGPVVEKLEAAVAVVDQSKVLHSPLYGGRTGSCHFCQLR